MALEIVERKSAIDAKIGTIEKSLGSMLEKLNDELESIVARVDSKVTEADKSKLGAILEEIDTLIINDPTIQGYLLSEEEPTRKKVTDLIERVQVVVKGTIANFKDSKEFANLSAESFKEVQSVYDAKVTNSATVTRTKTLEEYRTKVGTVTLSTAKMKLDEIEKALKDNESAMKKFEILKPKGGDEKTSQDAKKNIIAEIDGVKFDDAPMKRIKEISAYKLKDALALIGDEKQELTAEALEAFLNQLLSLKEKNPEIDKLLTDFCAKQKIKPAESDGKFHLEKIGGKRLTGLRQSINERLKSNPIDFKTAKENTINELIGQLEKDVNAVLDLRAMALYKDKVKQWKEDFAKGKLERKLDIWAEISKFLEEHDLKQEIEGIDLGEKTKLESEKKSLDAEKEKYTRLMAVEKYVDTRSPLKSINVNGTELKINLIKRDEKGETMLDKDGNPVLIDLLSLDDKSLTSAVANIYDDEDNKLAMRKSFEANAPKELKKVTLRDRLAFWMTHGKFPSKSNIYKVRAATWSEKQITNAIVKAVAEKGEAAEKVIENSGKLGALSPEQLREVRRKQAEALEKHKKAQAQAILKGETKTADEAVGTVKKKVDEQLEL